MKKIFYIHILLMAVSLLMKGSGAPYNNSTTVVSQNGLMSSFNPYQGTQYNSRIFVASQYNNTPRNRKERRAAGHKQDTQKKAQKVTIDDEVERISNTIDENFLGIKDDGNCCCNLLDRIMRRGAGYWSINSLFSESGIMRTLVQIDQYIQESPHQGATLIKLLEEKNGVVSRLIASVMWYKEKQGITGSTIDVFLDHGCIFPQLSPFLANYIGIKLKDMLFKLVYLKQQAGNSLQSTSVNAYFRRGEKYIDISSLCVYKRSSDIHSIALTGHKYPIDKDSIMVSHDDKYIKATDIPYASDFEDSTTIMWDMLTGQRCDNAEEESIVWKEKEIYEKNNRNINVIEFSRTNNKEQYHVSLCNTHHLFGFDCVDEKKQPALYLYKRPTWISDLCQTTFDKNRSNNDELNALLDSQMVQKKLTGFPQKNLIKAIQKAKNDNSHQ